MSKGVRVQVPYPVPESLTYCLGPIKASTTEPGKSVVINTRIAQLVMHLTLDQRSVGSNPASSANKNARLPKWL